MNKVFSLCIAIAIFALVACNQKTQFTDVKIMTEDGNTYIAHVIQPRVSVPDTGDVIPILRTEATDGYLYNSNAWTKEDGYKVLGGVSQREIIFGKVIEIIYPKQEE